MQVLAAGHHRALPGQADDGQRRVANLRKSLVQAGDVHDSQQRRAGRGQLERPAGTPRVPGNPSQDTTVISSRYIGGTGASADHADP